MQMDSLACPEPETMLHADKTTIKNQQVFFPGRLWYPLRENFTFQESRA